jgi:hypothetical protein
MSGAFGLLDDHHHTRVPRDLIAESNARLDLFWLLRVGALVQGTVTTVEIGGTGEGQRPARTANVCRQGSGVTIDGSHVALAWDSPMPGVERPWFVCPGCDRRCRFLYLRDSIACRRCHGLDYASRHIARQTPGVARVARLRRRLGCDDLRPFAPLPARRRGRTKAFHDALISRILDEEAALLDHLGGIVFDLKRRIRVRKARHQW